MTIYGNAKPIVPPVSDCFTDIPETFLFTETYGNNIAASACFVAFPVQFSSVAVLHVDNSGIQKGKYTATYKAHNNKVNYLEFSKFYDNILATASEDSTVKIWQIRKSEPYFNFTRGEECTFRHKQGVKTVGFHPTADCLLHTTSGGYVNLWDITSQKEVLSNNEHPDVIQSLSWKQDGRILATSCGDKMVRILDPRNSNIIQMSADSHQSNIDSRVVWLGDQDRILTTGFNAAGLGQIIIRDTRNFVVPEKTIDIDCSTIGLTFDPEMDYLTGIFMPLFDPDTNMLFLAGKGENTILHMEVTGNDPHLIEGIRHTGEETIGACLVPKRALKVMEGEVNRVLQLTSSKMVIPITYQVPRESYNEFHSDLYPDTTGYKTELTATQWMNGANIPVAKISLDPAKRELGDGPIIELKMDKEPEPKPLLKPDGKILKKYLNFMEFQKNKRGDAVRYYTIEENKEDFKEYKSLGKKINQKKYKCVICKLTFKASISLQSHMELHKEENKCSVCGSKFKRYQSLYLHMRKFHKEISFDKEYHKNILKKHKNKCVFCNEGFLSAWALYIHINQRHEGNQQQQKHKINPKMKYKCIICKKTLKTSVSLQKHMEVCHKEEIKCSVCGNIFTSHSHLYQHMRKYHKEISFDTERQKKSLKNPHKCCFCNKGYSLKKNLKRHYNMKHKGQVQQQPQHQEDDDEETALEGTSEIEGLPQDIVTSTVDFAEFFKNQKRNLPSTSRSAAIVEPPPPSKEADLVDVFVVVEEVSDEEVDKENKPSTSSHELDTTAELLEVDEEIIEISDTDEAEQELVEVLVEQASSSSEDARQPLREVQRYRCRFENCIYSSKLSNNRNRHEQTHQENEYEYKCNVCQKRFKQPGSIRKHFLKKHK